MILFKEHAGYEAASKFMWDSDALGSITFACALAEPGTTGTTYGYTLHKLDPKTGLLDIGGGPCHYGVGMALAGNKTLYANGAKMQFLCNHLRSGLARQETEAQAWYDYIFSKELSPWRDLFKDMPEVEFFHNKKDKLPRWFAMSISNETNAPFLINFLIATRVPREHTAQLTAWYNMVHKHGINPTLAFYLTSISSHTSVSSAGVKITVGAGGVPYNPGHHPITARNHEEQVRRLNDGAPYLNKEWALTSGNGYIPCNAIWFANNTSYHNARMARPEGDVKLYLVRFQNGKKVKVKVDKAKRTCVFAGSSAFLVDKINEYEKTLYGDYGGGNVITLNMDALKEFK